MPCKAPWLNIHNGRLVLCADDPRAFAEWEACTERLRTWMRELTPHKPIPLVEWLEMTRMPSPFKIVYPVARGHGGYAIPYQRAGVPR